MAGHSHWAQIRRKKSVVDKKRGALWSKLVRAVIMAARSGGPNPDMNFRLRLAIDKAKAANVPRETLERAIGKGSGEDGTKYRGDQLRRLRPRRRRHAIEDSHGQSQSHRP